MSQLSFAISSIAKDNVSFHFLKYASTKQFWEWQILFKKCCLQEKNYEPTLLRRLEQSPDEESPNKESPNKESTNKESPNKESPYKESSKH